MNKTKLLSQIEESRELWQSLEQRPLVRIGMATCGRSAGADKVLQAMKSESEKLGLALEFMEVGCFGMCYAEPLVDISYGGRRLLYGGITPEQGQGLVVRLSEGLPLPEEHLLGTFDEGPDSIWEHPMLKGQVRIVTENCGHIDPRSISQYMARGGFQGFLKALEMEPQEVIEEVKRSGLRGRGGAGFPTGRKWELCRKASGEPKYIVCNADEGDPGAFMDRSVLEGDPFRVIEGMLIGAYAIGARYGYIYCRAEYPLALEMLRNAIDQMYAAGLLGEDILGTGFSFDIFIFEGAGAFVCGEETALIRSIMGYDGRPVPRPPFPAEKGLFGKPTNINNVETWANIPWIMRNGADAFKQYGTADSPGTKTFSLTGKVRRTGLIEVPMGMTVRQIVEDIGGGTLSGEPFKAVQTGGPSGGCIPSSYKDTPVDYENLRKLGSIMGSGGLVVMDQSTCMVDVAKYFLRFTLSESCGKCIPCREGSKVMFRMLDRITKGQGTLDDLDKLEEVGNVIIETALCGLGQSMPNPVLTTLKYFRDEYIAHVVDKRCPAQVCKDLLTHTIDPHVCKGCGLCKMNCPAGAIYGDLRSAHHIDPEKCIKCGTCVAVCKFGAVSVQ